VQQATASAMARAALSSRVVVGGEDAEDLVLPGAGAVHFPGRVDHELDTLSFDAPDGFVEFVELGLKLGVGPKYFSTNFFAWPGSKSPAITKERLFGV
jgi:hypothetical protein